MARESCMRSCQGQPPHCGSRRPRAKCVRRLHRRWRPARLRAPQDAGQPADRAYPHRGLRMRYRPGWGCSLRLAPELPQCCARSDRMALAFATCAPRARCLTPTFHNLQPSGLSSKPDRCHGFCSLEPRHRRGCTPATAPTAAARSSSAGGRLCSRVSLIKRSYIPSIALKSNTKTHITVPIAVRVQMRRAQPG